MRIVIVTQSEPFYLTQTVKMILLERKTDVIAIVALPFKLVMGSIFQKIWHSLTVYGIGTSIVMAFRLLKIKIGKLYSLPALAKACGVPLFYADEINSVSSVEKIKQLHPDLIISLSATQKFSRDILSLPKFGCINVHCAPLPRYRGVIPNFWVLFNNEPKTAVTVHYINEKIDAGDIILQREIEISPGETLHSLITKTRIAAAEVVLEAVRSIETGSVVALPNDQARATYYSAPTLKELLLFKKKGKRFV